MKDCSKHELESHRPNLSTFDAVEHCLNALFADSTRNTGDRVVDNLLFEELIGALLLARDDAALLRHDT